MSLSAAASQTPPAARSLQSAALNSVPFELSIAVRYLLARRKQAFDRVQWIVGDRQPVIYLARENLVVAVRGKFGNVNPSVLRPHVLWNLYEIALDSGGRQLARR